jgi:Trk K+ transport system NAD-binding subunit
VKRIRSIILAIKQLKSAFFLLVGTIIMGSLIFSWYYLPSFDLQYTGAILDNIIATIALLLSMEVYTFPHGGDIVIKLLYIVYPFLGLVLIGIGIIEFGMIVFTYRYRISAWNDWLAKDMEHHTILVGLGNVGSRVLNELKEDGVSTTVITLEDGKSTELINELLEHPSIALIFGDATQRPILEKANVQKARALIAVTNDDLVNFKIATVAKELNPNLRTVIRAFDVAFSKKVTELFDIDAALSTSAIAAPAFVATSFEDGIIQTLKSKKGKTDIHLMEIEISSTKRISPLIVESVERQFDITILAIDNQPHPESDDKIPLGSKLLILGEIKALRQLKSQFC